MMLGWVCATLVNVNRGKGSKPVSARDFMRGADGPFAPPPEAPPAAGRRIAGHAERGLMAHLEKLKRRIRKKKA